MSRIELRQSSRVVGLGWGRLLAVAVVLACYAILTPAVHAGGEQVSNEEQKGRDFINRHTMGIHNWAHTGAKYTSLQYSRTDRNLNGFTLVYQHEWVSSLTKNKNSTTWSFQFDKNGKFKNFSYQTTWPTGAFENVDLTIAVVRQTLLNDPNITDPTLRQLIQNAPSGRELFRILLVNVP